MTRPPEKDGYRADLASLELFATYNNADDNGRYWLIRAELEARYGLDNVTCVAEAYERDDEEREWSTGSPHAYARQRGWCLGLHFGFSDSYAKGRLAKDLIACVEDYWNRSGRGPTTAKRWRVMQINPQTGEFVGRE